MREHLKRIRVEPERSRPGGWRERDVDDDEYARKLSQFNRTLAGGELTSMKFEWANLLAGKSGKTGFGTGNDNVGPSERTRRREYNAVLPSGSVKEHVGRGLYREEEKLGFERRELQYPFGGLKDDYNVTCKESVGREGHFGQTPAAAIWQLGRRNYARGSIVDSIVDKVEATCGSMRDDARGSRQLELNGGLQVGENCALQRDGALESNAEALERLKGSNHDNEVTAEKVLKRGRVVDLSMVTRNGEHDSTLDWNSTNEIYDSSRTLPHNLLSSPFYTMSMEEHSSEPVKRSSMDIKNRLEHPAGSTNKRVRQLGKPIEPSSQVVEKHLRADQIGQSKSHIRNLDDCQEGANVHGDDCFEVKIKSLNTEQVEHNKCFEQLVHSAFMKFVKVLFEDTAQRIKLTEKGGTLTLECCVCCRSSKKFVDILSLVKHAFNSQKVGFRAEHLGLHRALCMLMGWNYGATPNGGWAPRVLPYAEALALKQDLLIWPPVVFVHNTSIANTSPDEQIIVSIEELESIIKGMGFGWGITKVCHGKAANQSVMAVNFHGTLSGLQEAERLHKLYAENKHGREELEYITSQSNSSSDRTLNAEKVEGFLYGYLGIAEDLDKLDFVAKRRSFVKSKKEIQAIAGKRTIGD